MPRQKKVDMELFIFTWEHIPKNAVLVAYTTGS